MADFLTLKEKKGVLSGLKIAYFGDGKNNVTYDLMRMCAILGNSLTVACPTGINYVPESEVLEEIKYLEKKYQNGRFYVRFLYKFIV